MSDCPGAPLKLTHLWNAILLPLGDQRGSMPVPICFTWLPFARIVNIPGAPPSPKVYAMSEWSGDQVGAPNSPVPVSVSRPDPSGLTVRMRRIVVVPLRNTILAPALPPPPP